MLRAILEMEEPNLPMEGEYVPEEVVPDFFPTSSSGVAIAAICALSAAVGSLYQVRRQPY